MTVWFVSRHQGAIDWAVRESGFAIDRFEPHLNTDEVADGDVVLGTLPLHLAADVCAKGAVFYFLQLPQELSGRGSEYTPMRWYVWVRVYASLMYRAARIKAAY